MSLTVIYHKHLLQHTLSLSVFLFGLCRGHLYNLKCAWSSCFGLLLRSRVPTSYACVGIFFFIHVHSYVTKHFPCRGERQGAAANNESPRVVSPAPLIHCFVYIILQSNPDPSLCFCRSYCNTYRNDISHICSCVCSHDIHPKHLGKL